MKNDNLTYDWLDYLSEIKSARSVVLFENIETETGREEQIKITPVQNNLNKKPRGANKIEGIVIHHTATNDPRTTLNVLAQRGYSTNYEVDQQGNIYQYLDPKQFIAIASNTANSNTIAIDITTGKSEWPEAQKKSLVSLVRFLSRQYGFGISIAPDKGPFVWQQWKKMGNYTIFRHRNFHATACPSNLPIEQILGSNLTENKIKKKIIKESIIKVDNNLRREPRQGKIEGIVIHHTHTRSAKSTLSVLLQRNYSTNYEVDQEGNVYEYLNPDQFKAIATGGGANEHTIAIDVTHVGNDAFPIIQIEALKNLVDELASKYGLELKLAPDEGPKKWQDWKATGENYTLFRHRNFVATGCPMNLPMEELVSGVSNNKQPDILSKAYDFIKNLGSKAYDKIRSALAESIDRKLFDIQDNSENQIYKKYQKYFDALLSFLKKELKITKPVKIVFEEDEKNSKKPLGRTGGYLNEENKIHIFVTGRHVKDVMRSLAHEMVHHRQNIRGEFKKSEPTTNGYAQKNPHLRKMEKEAFLKGNMLFRDWEDNYKYRGDK